MTRFILIIFYNFLSTLFKKKKTYLKYSKVQTVNFSFYYKKIFKKNILFIITHFFFNNL